MHLVPSGVTGVEGGWALKTKEDCGNKKKKTLWSELHTLIMSQYTDQGISDWEQERDGQQQLCP